MMDRLSKWAIAGSLAWLVLAVGLILGTHRDVFPDVGAIEAQSVTPAASWSVMPAANTELGLADHDFNRC